MWPQFGLKIGNSTLCIASIKADKKIEVIANKQGDRVSDACLLYQDEELECGLTAKQKLPSRPAACVTNNFQLLKPIEELTETTINEARKYIPCAYDECSNKYDLSCQSTDPATNREISPSEVCVQLLKAELELARQCHLDDPSQPPSVVLSMPHYYTQGSRKILRSAAEQAGFKVAQIISEPVAATLAYYPTWFQASMTITETDNDTVADCMTTTNNVTKNVLCIKSGGLLSSFTLIKIIDGLCSVEKSIGPFYIGGKEFTDPLVDFISDQFYKKYRLDPHESRRSMAKIRTAADNCKHCLTTMPSTQVYIDSLMDGIDFNMQMSRARYEMLIQPTLNEFATLLNNTKSELLAQLNGNDDSDDKINEIVLCGATAKIPALQDLIANSFPDANLNALHAPDEVVAIGCAYQTMFVPDQNDDDNDADSIAGYCLSHDVYIWHRGNVNEKRLVLKKSTVALGPVDVSVPESTIEDTTVNGNYPTDGGELFHIGFDDVAEPYVVEAKTDADGYFRIQVTFVDDVHDDNKSENNKFNKSNTLAFVKLASL